MIQKCIEEDGNRAKQQINETISNLLAAYSRKAHILRSIHNEHLKNWGVTVHQQQFEGQQLIQELVLATTNEVDLQSQTSKQKRLHVTEKIMQTRRQTAPQQKRHVTFQQGGPTSQQQQRQRQLPPKYRGLQVNKSSHQLKAHANPGMFASSEDLKNLVMRDNPKRSSSGLGKRGKLHADISPIISKKQTTLAAKHMHNDQINEIFEEFEGDSDTSSDLGEPESNSMDDLPIDPAASSSQGHPTIKNINKLNHHYASQQALLQKHSHNKNYSSMSSAVSSQNTLSRGKPREVISQILPVAHVLQRGSSANQFVLLQQKKIEQQRKMVEELKQQVIRTLDQTSNKIVVQALAQDEEENLLPKADSEIKRYSGNMSGESMHIESSPVQESSVLSKGSPRSAYRHRGDLQLALKDRLQKIQSPEEAEMLRSVRHALRQICELTAACQTFKYLLRNKQYQIADKLSLNELTTAMTIDSKCLQKGICRVLQGHPKKHVEIVNSNIFRKAQSISLEEFGEVLNSCLSASQFECLKAKKEVTAGTRIMEVLSKLFCLWIELDYFECLLSRNTIRNAFQLTQLKELVTERSSSNRIDLQEVQKFVYGTTKVRADRIKIEVLFKRKNPSLEVSRFMEWILSRKQSKTVGWSG